MIVAQFISWGRPYHLVNFHCNLFFALACACRILFSALLTGSSAEGRAIMLIEHLQPLAVEVHQLLLSHPLCIAAIILRAVSQRRTIWAG